MCSKYSLGVALANPALPTNPYRPLLRRYFDSTPLPAAPEALPGLATSGDMAVAVAA